MLITEEHGDSGSWMIQKETMRLYGHIVAGDPGSGLAYIMPGRRLFQDIEFQLGCEVALYSNLKVKPEDGNQERKSEGHLETLTLDTAILTPKLRENDPEIDGERQAFSPEELAQRNEYFVPRDGIDVDVITADLTLYLGNDVLLRTGSFQVRNTRTKWEPPIE
jgi:hypothetical protein